MQDYRQLADMIAQAAETGETTPGEDLQLFREAAAALRAQAARIAELEARVTEHATTMTVQARRIKELEDQHSKDVRKIVDLTLSLKD